MRSVEVTMQVRKIMRLKKTNLSEMGEVVGLLNGQLGRLKKKDVHKGNLGNGTRVEHKWKIIA